MSTQNRILNLSFTLRILLLNLLRAALSPDLRPLIPAIWRWSRTLPARYEAQPLPDFLAEITPSAPNLSVDSDHLRGLIDALAWLDRRSPFGLCLRRALWRTYWLQRAGVPLGIVFGVRFRGEHEPLSSGVAGHAWNILDGAPWHEREDDYRGFTEIYRWEQKNSD